MRYLFSGSACTRQALHLQPHRLRVLAPPRAFAWEPLNKLKDKLQDKLPSLTVLRERFPIRWPIQKGGRSDKRPPREPSQQPLKPPELSVRQAVQQGSIGFGFSAGGMLFPYYIGVTQSLTDLQVLTSA